MSDLVPIDDGAATMGTVAVTTSPTSGGSGFNLSPSRVLYPAEFPATQWAHSGHAVQWDIVLVQADGFFWDNKLAISATGFVSADSGDAVVRPHSDHPTVPMNRFLDLTFAPSSTSEGLSAGSLNIDILPGATEFPEGTALVPRIPLRVQGHFDPVGVGDATFSFTLLVNTMGYIELEDVTTSSPYGLHIYQDGNHVLVQMEQITSF